MKDIILQEYEIRKSNPEKTRFIEYIKTRLAHAGYDPEKDITVEEKGKGLFLSRNIVVTERLLNILHRSISFDGNV